MRLAIKVTKIAAKQITEASHWWDKNRQGSDTFREEIASAFMLITAFPKIGSPARSKRFSGVRRLHLGRVNYWLYYRVADGVVAVLTLWHTSRGSSPRL